MTEIPEHIIKQFEEAVAASGESDRENRLLVEYKDTYEAKGEGPYPWQVDFHNRSGNHRERMLSCGNRCGKTQSAAAEVAIHLTGRYPEWWKGRQFIIPIEAWGCGTTNEDMRNIQQNALIGDIDENRNATGTGWIPKKDIVDISFRQGTGVSNIVETIKVRHTSGGVSMINMKSYEQGAVKYQGVAKHLVWMDEEPEKGNQDIFSEVQMRLADHRGMLLFSRTPLFGRTKMVKYFFDKVANADVTTAAWDDCPHWTPEMIAEETLKCPKHELMARRYGIPQLGSGGIYEMEDELISCDPFTIPDHFRRVCGLDIGIQHPTAVVWIAHDPDSDIIYVYDCHRQSDETPIYHAAAIKTRGDWIPLVLPHDSLVREKGTGMQMMQLYRDQGLNVVDLTARYDDEKGGGQSPERIIMEIQTRMRTGTFKVFAGLRDWFQEKNQYHRDEGKIIRVDDDLISATHYAVMMKRYAITGGDHGIRNIRNFPRTQKQSDYDPYSVL